MEFDKGNMIVNEVDLDFLLKRYIYQYRFRNNNKLPKKIIIKSTRDYVELSEPQWAEVQGKKVKYECGGFGDSCGCVRARGDSKSTATKRGSKSGSTKPTIA